MKVTTFLIALLFCLPPDTKDWKTYTSYEGRFTILTPGEMELRTKSIETAVGTMDYHTYLYQPDTKDADNLVYMVSYCDYPEGAIHSDSTDLLDDFFNTTLETAVKSVKGELLYESEIQHKSYPGRLWRVNYNEGNASIKTKAYLVGRRYYSVQTITLKDKSLNPFIDKFLDSFSIVDR